MGFFIKSVERDGYRYDVYATGMTPYMYDVHRLHRYLNRWVDAGFGRYCTTMQEVDAYIQAVA